MNVSYSNSGSLWKSQTQLNSTEMFGSSTKALRKHFILFYETIGHAKVMELI